MNELETVLRKFARAMKQLKIPFVIVGGFAVAGWGRPRGTKDIDAIIEVREKDVPRLVLALCKGGFTTSEQDILDAIRHKEHFSIFDPDTVFHVDAKGVYGKSEAMTLRSRVEVTYKGYKIPISGLEDTIANKLRFGREQDLEDAMSIYIQNRSKVKNRVLEALCIDFGVVKELGALVGKAKRLEEKALEDNRHR